MLSGICSRRMDGRCGEAGLAIASPLMICSTYTKYARQCWIQLLSYSATCWAWRQSQGQAGIGTLRPGGSGAVGDVCEPCKLW